MFAEFIPVGESFKETLGEMMKQKWLLPYYDRKSPKNAGLNFTKYLPRFLSIRQRPLLCTFYFVCKLYSNLCYFYSCGQQEDPAISGLLLCMCHMYVCSQHSFGLALRMYGMHRMQFDHRCFDLLSRETCTEYSIGAKVFWPSIVVACTL